MDADQYSQLYSQLLEQYFQSEEGKKMLAALPFLQTMTTSDSNSCGEVEEKEDCSCEEIGSFEEDLKQELKWNANHCPCTYKKKSCAWCEICQGWECDEDCSKCLHCNTHPCDKCNTCKCSCLECDTCRCKCACDRCECCDGAICHICGCACSRKAQRCVECEYCYKCDSPLCLTCGCYCKRNEVPCTDCEYCYVCDEKLCPICGCDCKRNEVKCIDCGHCGICDEDFCQVCYVCGCDCTGECDKGNCTCACNCE